VTYLKASQGGMFLKVSYNDIVCFEIASVQWGD